MRSLPVFAQGYFLGFGVGQVVPLPFQNNANDIVYGLIGIALNGPEHIFQFTGREWSAYSKERVVAICAATFHIIGLRSIQRR